MGSSLIEGSAMPIGFVLCFSICKGWCVHSLAFTGIVSLHRLQLQIASQRF